MARVFMKGCEAIAEAAVRAGCRFSPDIRLHPRMKSRNILQGDCLEVGGEFVRVK